MHYKYCIPCSTYLFSSTSVLYFTTSYLIRGIWHFTVSVFVLVSEYTHCYDGLLSFRDPSIYLDYITICWRLKLDSRGHQDGEKVKGIYLNRSGRRQGKAAQAGGSAGVAAGLTVALAEASVKAPVSETTEDPQRGQGWRQEKRRPEHLSCR